MEHTSMKHQRRIVGYIIGLASLGAADLALMPTASADTIVPHVNHCVAIDRARSNEYGTAVFRNLCTAYLQVSFCYDISGGYGACGRPIRSQLASGIPPGGMSSLPNYPPGAQVYWVACEGGTGEVIPIMEGGKGGCRRQ